MKNFEGKPAAVRRAQHNADHAALSAMGRKGAAQAEENRIAFEAQREEEIVHLAAAQAQLYQVTNEGDVLPPDLPEEGQIVH